MDWFLYDKDLRHERVKFRNLSLRGEFFIIHLFIFLLVKDVSFTRTCRLFRLGYVT